MSQDGDVRNCRYMVGHYCPYIVCGTQLVLYLKNTRRKLYQFYFNWNDILRGILNKSLTYLTIYLFKI